MEVFDLSSWFSPQICNTSSTRSPTSDATREIERDLGRLMSGNRLCHLQSLSISITVEALAVLAVTVGVEGMGETASLNEASLLQRAVRTKAPTIIRLQPQHESIVQFTDGRVA
jgi:hypothetical protein